MDVGAWLDALGLGEYAQAFAENDIDAETLSELTAEDLKELGVSKLGHRKKLLAAINDLAPGLAEAPSSLAESASAVPAGERRQVTVLFADLSGFTGLSRDRDAEETHALLNRYFGAVDGVVQGYGGAVDKHIGDAVMAVFGAPLAHGNDPERAVRAALDIHRAVAELSPPMQVHIGVASGQVVASGTGSQAHREYTVTGDTVNLASRLQDMASPQDTLISDAVYRSIADLVACELMEDVAVKGLDGTVRVWRVLGLEAGEAGRRRRPLVGRRGELRQFTGAVDACLETGNGQAIYVRGEAGIGKSRLVEEYQAIAEAQGFACHTGLVLDFGVGKGQDAVRTVVRSLLDIPAGGDKVVRAAAAKKALADGVFERDRQVYLNDLLDLPQPTELRAMYDAMDNATRDRGKRETVAELVRRSSARQPVVITIEDVHWADAIVLAHLSSLAGVVVDCPAMLIMTSRIEGDPLDQAWRATTGGVSLLTMDLGPLRTEEALQLAGEYFDASHRLAMSCVERAEGNPLFLEQLLRSAKETMEESLPGSVQSIVLARVDNLESHDKQALQGASVIGQRFTLDLLRHLIDRPQYTCEGLIEHTLVRPDGEDYLFAHALVREGVYSSLLKARKRELHRAAAAWFEDRDPVLRAEHLDRAEDPAAAQAYLAAARAQAAEYRYERALNLVERGLDLADDGAAKHELTC
ncbi:MAG: adenylate/guanylate cyclase domain-containing protein, partial [Kiloniellales bacterium]